MKRIRFMMVLALALVAVTAGAQPPGPHPEGAARGGRFFFGFVLGALQRADLIVLTNGGQLSGTLSEPALTVSSQFGTEDFPREELSSLVLDTVFRSGAPSRNDQIFLKSGDRLVGRVEAEAFQIVVPGGETIALPRERVAAIFFKVDLPSDADDRERFRALRATFRGVQSNTVLRGLMRLGFQQFDLAIRADGLLESVRLQAEGLSVDSERFGTLQFALEEVAAAIFDEPSRLVLRTGDQVQGPIRVADAEAAETFPAVRAYDGAAVAFRAEELRALVIHLPAGSFGSGGPGFQGGPGK